MVAMRDGVKLHTYVLLPAAGSTPAPTVLLRTPYWDVGDAERSLYKSLTGQGYAFVWQSCRGTGKSEGQLDFVRQEIPDGQDMVQWVSKQPWSNGKLGTLGGSYEGVTALAAAVNRPEVKVVIADGIATDAFASWPGTTSGVPSWNYLWWVHVIATGEVIYDNLTYLSRVTNARPFADLDVATIGKRNEPWRQILPQLGQPSKFWEEHGMRGRLGAICAPVIYFQAKDEAIDDSLASFLEMNANPCDSATREGLRFVLGDHHHTGAVTGIEAANPSGKLLRAYLAKYLKGEVVDLSQTPRVQLYLQNAGTWQGADAWPVATATRELFLSPPPTAGAGGSLSTDAPTVAGEYSYLFDPQQDDDCDPRVLTGAAFYQSSKLTSPVDIAGAPEVVLHLSVDRPDADLFAYLVEVTATGTERFASMGVLRMRFRKSFASPELLTPGQVVEVKLTMNNIGFRLDKGSTIYLIVQSSACGHPENTNTGEDTINGTATLAATIRIKSGPGFPTRLRLPTIN